MIVLFSLLVTFVWWAKDFSNVSKEDKCFHWATLMFFHSHSSHTVVKCSFTWSIQHMTGNNECHQALCCSTWLVYFLHNSQCTNYSYYMLVQFQYKATWTLPTDKFFWVIFLTYWRFTSAQAHSSLLSISFSFRSGNNSSLSSSVTLYVSDSSPSDSIMSSSLCYLLWKLQPCCLLCQLKL